MSNFKLKYEKMKLIIGHNEIKVFNMEDGSLITILNSMTDETMEECFSGVTEMLTVMGVKFTFNDDYFYNKYGRRLVPKIRK